MLGNILTYLKYIFHSSRIEHENNSANVRKLDNGFYEVSYKIKGRNYKMIVLPERGPPKVSNIVNYNGMDVTEEVLPYMGPNYDWKHTTSEIPYQQILEENGHYIDVYKFTGEKETIYFSPI